MSEATTQQQGEQRRGGMRGRQPRNNRGPQNKGGKDKWQPKTKLGRLGASGRITSIEQIYLNAIPIKEPEIVTPITSSNW